MIGRSCVQCRQGSARRKAKGLDDLAGFRTPEPGAPGNQRVRNLEGERTARKRQAVRSQMRAELRQQPVGARGLGSRVDKKGERGGKPHGAIMGLTRALCHGLSLITDIGAYIS